MITATILLVLGTIVLLFPKILSFLVATTSELDSTTIGRLRSFEVAIKPYLGNEASPQSDKTLLDKANELEVDFAQRHPRAEGIMREIIDTLSRMGI